MQLQKRYIRLEPLASSPQETQPKIPVAAYHIISVSVQVQKSGQARGPGGGLAGCVFGLVQKCHSVFLNSPRQFKSNGQDTESYWGKGEGESIPQRRANPPVSARREISPSLGPFCLSLSFRWSAVSSCSLSLSRSDWLWFSALLLACHVSFCDDAPNCRGPNRHSRWAVICRQKADRRTPNGDH
ncbi:hypothetical protein CI102_9079 [Trichoderma harzianum]|nr:hypothetical protein CI102_9079 [Trichoderma harzianum]